jgi:preprotein translocase subunit SecF
MFIVGHRKIFYTLSALLVIGSIVSLFVYGLNFGIDFKGGTIIEVEYVNVRPEIDLLNAGFVAANLQGVTLRSAGDRGIILRMPEVTNDVRQTVESILSSNGQWPYVETRSNAIGPTLGSELKTKALLSILLVIIAIILFIAFAFRKVSEPVSSWKYGLMAIVGLIHNVIIPTGVFAALGHFMGAEVDGLFVTALLVILGFSVHDTIVVFDRVRENLRKNAEYNRKEEFEHVVGRSVSQTLARSINTSLTTLLTLLALYFIGPESTKYFSLALLVGSAAGTYSSICLASPLLVTAEKLQKGSTK